MTPLSYREIRITVTVNETILSVIPGATEHQRLVIVSRAMDTRYAPRLHDPESAEMDRNDRLDRSTLMPFCEQMHCVRDRPIVLRQESFSPAVGWFTQSELELTMQQWTVMRTTISPTSSPNCGPRSMVTKKRAAVRRLPCDPEVVAFPFDPDRAVPA